jgi:hypothetical protein
MTPYTANSTYALDEVAALTPPSEMKNSPRWLAERLNYGDLSGSHVGRM